MKKRTLHKEGQSTQTGLNGSQQVKIDAEAIPQERIKAMARPLLASVRKAFEDPAFAAEYEHWKAERDARIRQG